MLLNLGTSCGFQLNNTERRGKTSGPVPGVVMRSGKVIMSIHTGNLAAARAEQVQAPGSQC